MKFRKKSVVIEAIQWNGDNILNVLKFLNADEDYIENDEFFHDIIDNKLHIKTSEGVMLANFGDWIIKEPSDKERKFYPCKKEIFEKTYEIVD